MNAIIILITVGIYFILQLAVPSRKSTIADSDSSSGSRQSKQYVVALTMTDASISGVTYISIPGMVDKSGFGYSQLVMGFIVGQLIIAFVLTLLFHRMKLTSVYEYLSNRPDLRAYYTGAWLFFISKMLGAAVRLFLACFISQMLAFEPLGVLFIVDVFISVGFMRLYTYRGGVESMIWADVIKTCCLVTSMAFCICFIARDMRPSLNGTFRVIGQSNMNKMLFFGDPNDKQLFFKQFLAGIFAMITTNGLDQDIMQRNLNYHDSRELQKDMVFSIIFQLIAVSAFLMLGVLLYFFTAQHGMSETGDKLFLAITAGPYLPMVVDTLFIVSLASSACNTAGATLTALTISFTIDILGGRSSGESHVKRMRQRVHLGMAILAGVITVTINILNSTSVIDTVYILASYTYGPSLGMFVFGIIMKQQIHDRHVSWVAIATPILCLILDKHSMQWSNDYQFSYGILIFNTLFTFLGLYLLIRRK